MATYDTLGIGYAGRRIPDHRIAARIHAALGHANSVVNVGAGTESYEPTSRMVVAVEPSMTMIRQRTAGSAPAIQALASHLPLRDGSVQAAMSVLTVHHWSALSQSLGELGRVARERIVILTWEPDSPEFWLTQEYFPDIRLKDSDRFPTVRSISRELGRVRVETVPIPRDCSDGFLGAYWCRPHAYLDAGTRSSMSGFIDLPNIEEGLARLRRDLEVGTWERRFGHLRNEDDLDLGYRLVIKES